MENKLAQISNGAEECTACNALIEDELSNTFTSIKEDHNKINNIPSIHIHKFIRSSNMEDYNSSNINNINFNINKNNTNRASLVSNQNKDFNINKLKYGTNLNHEVVINEASSYPSPDKKSVDNEAFKFNNNLNTFNNLNNNSISLNVFTDEKNFNYPVSNNKSLSSPAENFNCNYDNSIPNRSNNKNINPVGIANNNIMNKVSSNDEENILDDNAGGLEYYKYLEKKVFNFYFNFFYYKHAEMKGNIHRLEEEYESKSKNLITEIEVSYFIILCLLFLLFMTFNIIIVNFFFYI